MLTYFESLSWPAGSVLMVLSFILFAIVGLLITRRIFAQKALKANHDVAGFVYANLGVLYAVLLGFTVVNAQERFDKIKQTAEIEASYLVELYRDAGVFPEKNKQEIRKQIKNYAAHVIADEWFHMAQGSESSDTISALNNLWNAYYQLEPANTKQMAWYSESLSKLNSLMSARLARIIGSHEWLGTEMWSLLILGGLIMIIFIWFFGLESTVSHILMASILAASIAFLLFLIYSLDSAYTGTIKVTPEAMEKVYNSF